MTDHTQDCIDAFYGDGGQSGCICGADDEPQSSTDAIGFLRRRVENGLPLYQGDVDAALAAASRGEQ